MSSTFGPGSTLGSVDGPDASPPVTDAVRVQILATEHWSLLATRQLASAEAFSRAGLFLTVLSASVVALALVAQTGSDRDLTLFSLLLLPVVLMLGVATFFRLSAINQLDERLLVGMNRLRRGYLDVAPDLEPYFITGSHDDNAGLARTAGLDGTFSQPFPLQVLVSTPVVIGVLDGVIAGVLTGVVARWAGLSSGPAVGLGVLSGLVLLGLLALLPARQLSAWVRTYQPRFSSPTAEPDR
jgi:hypothetical protein